jgi:hypothetical protein
MKPIALTVLALGILAAGCSSPTTVANLQGQGTRHIYNAPYPAVWRATVDAAQSGDLNILQADPRSGFLSLRRGPRVETFGENVAIYVREAGPAQTEVEVISRQAGPPKFWMRNWERPIHNAIAANLTRDPAAIGTPPNEPYTGQGVAPTTRP